MKNLNDEQLEKVLENPMSNETITKFLPDARIISYDELKKYKSIDELMPEPADYTIILYTTSPNNGHWTSLIKYAPENGKDGIIEYFDSYGNPIDTPLKWIGKGQGPTLGIDAPYLSNLLKKSPYTVISNSIPYQDIKKPDIATCGRHVCNRVISFIGKRYALDDYHNMMRMMKKKYGDNYDDIVSKLITKTD